MKTDSYSPLPFWWNVLAFILAALIILLLAHCLAAGAECGAARDSVTGINATVPLAVARYLAEHPADRGYFSAEASAIETHPALRKTLLPVIRAIHPPNPKAEKIIVTGSRFMLGASESADDPPCLCAALAAAIRSGCTFSVKDLQARSHWNRLQYAKLRAGEAGAPGQYSDQLHFSGSPPTLRRP